MEINMAKALIFLATGYEEVEMLTVVDLLRRAAIETDMVSITDSLSVVGSHDITIQADTLFADADFDNAQILILPGGMPGTKNLQAFEPLCEKLREFASLGKKLAAVCAAPSVLASLGLLEGKKATCYPTFADKLATGDYVKLPVVTDGNVITSRGMGTCIEFAGAIIEALADKATAEEIKKSIIYNDVY